VRENPWLQLQRRQHVCLKSVIVPIRANMARRVLGATSPLFHSRERNFGLAPRLDRCKVVRDRGGAFSKQLILRKPRRARGARRLCGIFFCNQPPEVGVS
jgi:hypothetical protein